MKKNQSANQFKNKNFKIKYWSWRLIVLSNYVVSYSKATRSSSTTFSFFMSSLLILYWVRTIIIIQVWYPSPFFRNLCNTLPVLEDNRSPYTFCHFQHESPCESSPPYVSKHHDQNQECQESVMRKRMWSSGKYGKSEQINTDLWWIKGFYHSKR